MVRDRIQCECNNKFCMYDYNNIGLEVHWLAHTLMSLYWQVLILAGSKFKCITPA